MKPDLADGQTLKQMLASGTAWLGKSAPDINAINVFPVPDGDTGANMVLTMKSALDQVKSRSDDEACYVAESLAHGALMGAWGNSGVILSQRFRGLEGKPKFDGGDLARALAGASRAAYKGIANPVEGTILTVLKDASKAAQEAGKNDATLVSVLEAAVESAGDSVVRTPSLLPALRDAGVVDAGGQGLCILLDGALQFLKGESHKMRYRRPRLVVAEKGAVPRATRRPAQLESPHGYCTNLVLEGQNLDSDRIEKDLRKKGQSLIVTGDDSLVRIHIHSFKPGEILQYAANLGSLHDITVNNMDDQYSEFIKMQRERMPQVDIAVVAVATGDGFLELLNSLGDMIIVHGGQTMNPSVHELLQAVESAPSDNVILLPNNKNIIPTASQVQSLTSKKVEVIPSKNIPQGIAAFLAFRYDFNLEQNARAMEEASTRVKAVEVVRAVREICLKGLEIRKGQFTAILGDEDLIASADKAGDVILGALGTAGADRAAIITVYYGAEIKGAEAREMARQIRDRYKAEVEVVYGGQPHHHFAISLE